jgi:hypothetical protein
MLLLFTHSIAPSNLTPYALAFHPSHRTIQSHTICSCFSPIAPSNLTPYALYFHPHLQVLFIFCAVIAHQGVGDFSAVTLLASHDGGRSWDRALPPPQHVVAASPVMFTLGDNRLGFRSPSNIMQGHVTIVSFFFRGWMFPFGG